MAHSLHLFSQNKYTMIKRYKADVQLVMADFINVAIAKKTSGTAKNNVMQVELVKDMLGRFRTTCQTTGDVNSQLRMIIVQNIPMEPVFAHYLTWELLETFLGYQRRALPDTWGARSSFHVGLIKLIQKH